MLSCTIKSWEHVRFEGDGPSNRVCVLAAGVGIGDSICLLPCILALSGKFNVTLYTPHRDIFRLLGVQVIDTDIHGRCSNGETLTPDWDERKLREFGLLFKVTGELGGQHSAMLVFAEQLGVELPKSFCYEAWLPVHKVGHGIKLFAPESTSKARSIEPGIADVIERALPGYMRVGVNKGYHANSLMGLLSIVYSADDVISVDTGIAHIAAALGRPLTVIAKVTDGEGYYGQYRRFNPEWQLRVIQTINKENVLCQ